MSDLSNAPPPAIQWPAPIVNDSRDALEQAIGRAERLSALLTSANADLIDHIRDAGGFLHTTWLIYGIAHEKVDELKSLLEEIVEVLPWKEPQAATSVGKHTGIMRRADWIAAVNAFQAIENSGRTDDGDAAAAAFQAMVATRAPDLRAFHEKLTLIQQHDAWALDGAIPALFADVEAFARAEIAAQKLEG